MENVKLINNYLIRECGRSEDGRPNFRLVWAENMTEKIVGLHENWYKDTIFLGEEWDVREQPKYVNDRERWVLEKLLYSYNSELVGSDKGHYEPIYIFKDKKGNYLKPEMFAVEYLIWRIKNPEAKGASYWMALQEVERRRRLEYFLGQIGGYASPVEAAFSTREAISLNGKEFK